VLDLKYAAKIIVLNFNVLRHCAKMPRFKVAQRLRGWEERRITLIYLRRI
jgi:hypothetical protein